MQTKVYSGGSQLCKGHTDGRTQIVEARRAVERTADLKPPTYSPDAAKLAALRHLADANPSVSTGAQRYRVLAALRTFKGGLTTRDLAGALDIAHPPRRVLDLVEAGHHVVSSWVLQASERGTLHRTKLYVLAD